MQAGFNSYFAPTSEVRKSRLQKQQSLIKHMHKIVPEKYWEILTPDYEFGCRRRIIDTDRYRGLQAPRIELKPLPLTSVQEQNIILSSKRHYPPLFKTDNKTLTSERVVHATFSYSPSATERANGFIH